MIQSGFVIHFFKDTVNIFSWFFLFFFTLSINQVFLDPEAMNIPSPEAWSAPASDSRDNNTAVNKSGKENISALSVAQRIMCSCGLHHSS